MLVATLITVGMNKSLGTVKSWKKLTLHVTVSMHFFNGPSLKCLSPLKSDLFGQILEIKSFKMRYI